MAITRIYQESFDFLYSDWELLSPWITVESSPGTNSSGYTNYSAAFTSTAEGAYIPLDSAISQARAAFMFKLSSSADSQTGIFWLEDLGGNNVLDIWYNGSTHLWTVAANGTSLGTFTLDVTDNSWRHMGIDFKADASSGWAYVYIDGVAQVSYTGKTDYGNSDFDAIGIGPMSSTYGGWNFLYIDDFYADETTGEAAVTNPPLKRFYLLEPNGNGNYSQWYGSDGNQVNNYTLVDFGAGISNTISDGFVESATSTHRDSWTLDDSTGDISGATTIPAVIHQMFVLTRSVTDGITLTPFFRYSGTDDDGTSFTPPVHYANSWERFTTDPAGSAWGKTAIDALEMGVLFD